LIAIYFFSIVCYLLLVSFSYC